MKTIKKFIKSFKNYKKFKQNLNSNKNLVFFSEGSHHWAHLKYLINLVNEEKIIVNYVTIDENDECYNNQQNSINNYYISNLIILNFFFKTLKNSILITSLPDLGKYYFKKNNNNNKYIYIFHSLASIHTQYYYDSFKNFDIVFCAGPHHVREIRQIEKIYKFKKKLLIEYGYPRIDDLYINNDKKKYSKNMTKTILIAPSWGKNSITDLIIIDLISILLRGNFNIIYRPHKMSFVQNNKIIKLVQSKFSKNKLFNIDTSNSSTNTLYDSDILIADWGSTSADFSFGLTKPVLFINTPQKIRNEKYEIISKSSFETEIRKYVGSILEIGNIENINESIYDLIKKSKNYSNSINFISKKYIYNPLNSANIGSKLIIKYYSEK